MTSNSWSFWRDINFSPPCYKVASPQEQVIAIGDLIFSALFALDVTVRLLVLGPRFFKVCMNYAPWHDLDVGQNGRPRGPQMWMSSLVLTIQLLGYLILTHTHLLENDKHLLNPFENPLCLLILALDPDDPEWPRYIQIPYAFSMSALDRDTG